MSDFVLDLQSALMVKNIFSRVIFSWLPICLRSNWLMINKKFLTGQCRRSTQRICKLFKCLNISTTNCATDYMLAWYKADVMYFHMNVNKNPFFSGTVLNELQSKDIGKWGKHWFFKITISEISGYYAHISSMPVCSERTLGNIAIFL